MSDGREYTTLSMAGALFLLFLGLRLGGATDWSWYWVAAPLWVPYAVGASAMALKAPVWLIRRQREATKALSRYREREGIPKL